GTTLRSYSCSASRFSQCLFILYGVLIFFFFQAEDGIRDFHVTGVQTCALPIYASHYFAVAFQCGFRRLVIERQRVFPRLLEIAECCLAAGIDKKPNNRRTFVGIRRKNTRRFLLPIVLVIHGHYVVQTRPRLDVDTALQQAANTYDHTNVPLAGLLLNPVTT